MSASDNEKKETDLKNATTCWMNDEEVATTESPEKSVSRPG